mgnify:CR=1 FL=1
MLEVVEFSVNDTYEMFQEGEFVDGKTILALQYFMAAQLENYGSFQEERIESLEKKIAEILINFEPRAQLIQIRATANEEQNSFFVSSFLYFTVKDLIIELSTFILFSISFCKF